MHKKLALILLLVSFHLYAEKPADWREPDSIKSILSIEESEADLPRGLAHCVAYTESRFNPSARSRLVDNYRSCGLMQLYRRYIGELVGRFSSDPKGFRWDDPGDSAEVGCRYLAYLIKRFDGSVYLGLCAYNFGPTSLDNIKQWSDIPKPCRRYADGIMKLLDEYQEEW